MSMQLLLCYYDIMMMIIYLYLSDPDELIRRLQRSICDNETSLIAAQAERYLRC